MATLYLIAIFLLTIQFTTAWRTTAPRMQRLMLRSLATADPIESFSAGERFIFSLFSRSVAKELKLVETPNSYNRTIEHIHKFASDATANPETIHNRSKRILVDLFPRGLLTMYKASIGKYFPKLSAWMNLLATKWTTQWLMGPSHIMETRADNRNGTKLLQHHLHIEKCRFLETSGCIKTCTHACKVPTEKFFMEEMGLPVAVKPNFTDYSCKFVFGEIPASWDQDETIRRSCLSECSMKANSSDCLCSRPINK